MLQNKSMKKGKLIVIEGNDGSGKGTQHKLLLDYLKKNNISSASFDFPQYGKTFFGDFADRMLDGDFGHMRRINPYFSMFPYAGDRWQAKKELQRAMDLGKVVVCNRYAPSIAYQVVKIKPREREKFLAWADRLEYEIFGIPREDVVIFLYVPFDIAQKLIEKRGNGKDQNEEDASYLKKVEKMYLWLAKHKKNWVRIDCVKNGKMRSIEDIHHSVLKVLEEKKVI